MPPVPPLQGMEVLINLLSFLAVWSRRWRALELEMGLDFSPWENLSLAAHGNSAGEV